MVFRNATGAIRVLKNQAGEFPAGGEYGIRKDSNAGGQSQFLQIGGIGQRVRGKANDRIYPHRRNGKCGLRLALLGQTGDQPAGTVRNRRTEDTVMTVNICASE